MICDSVSGETFILYNQQVKGSKRELIQLGAPIFEHVKEDATCQKSKKKRILIHNTCCCYLWYTKLDHCIPPILLNFNLQFLFFHTYHNLEKCQLSGHNEPIPALLQGVINHLIQWHLISESRRPNSCIINFFDEVFAFILDRIMLACNIFISIEMKPKCLSAAYFRGSFHSLS